MKSRDVGGLYIGQMLCSEEPKSFQLKRLLKCNTEHLAWNWPKSWVYNLVLKDNQWLENTMSKIAPNMKYYLSSLTFYAYIYISVKETEFADSKSQPLKQDRTCWKSLSDSV